MSNVTLISPPEKPFLMEAGDRPYMSLLYLAGSLRKAGHRPLISDLNLDSYHDLNNKMKISDYAGITTFTPYFDWTVNFAKHLKQNFPKVKLIAGGPHATVEPESLTYYFDFVVKGEGERAIVDIADGKKLDNIIQYPYEENLDSLPIPLNELELGKYGMNQEGYNTITLLGSRSCNYNCSFCTKDILGKNFRPHSVDRILEEVKMAKKMGFNSIYFLDDCWTTDEKRALELTDRIKKLDISYRVMSRTDKLTEELAYRLKDSGARSVSFGLEHFDNNILKKLRKGTNVKTHLKAIDIAKNVGLKIRGSFIINPPGATKETVLKTLEIAKEKNLDFADFYALTAYPGTAIWKNPEKFDCKVDRKYGYSQLSLISNVDNGNFDMKELPKFIESVRNDWAKFKGLKCAWEAERYE